MKETENPLDLISSCDDNNMSKNSGSRILIMTVVLILLALIIVGVIIAIMVTNKVKKTVDSMTESKETFINEFDEDFEQDLDAAMNAIMDKIVEDPLPEEIEHDLDAAMATIDANVDSVFEQEFVTYDSTKVTGSNVINAIQLFSDRPIAIVVQTEKSCGPELALNYGALITSDCKESNGSTNSPLFDEVNQCYIVFVEGVNIGIQKNDNGRDYLASLHYTGDSVSYYYPDYERLNEEDDIQYIKNSQRFKSNLIRNDSGSIIGIYFREITSSPDKQVVVESTEETPIIKDDTVVEEKLDSVIFISDRKEFISDLTADELSKYDDKDITAQDVLDLSSIAVDKNTAVLIQTKALRYIQLNDGNTAVNYGVLLPSAGTMYSIPQVMTEHPELCEVYNGENLECSLDTTLNVDSNLVNDTTKFVVTTIVAEEPNPEYPASVYRYDNFYISDYVNNMEDNRVFYTHDTTALTDKENAAYIVPSHKYHANRIEDSRGNVIGIYIKEIE